MESQGLESEEGRVMDRNARHHWHVAINQYVWPKEGQKKDHESVKWMYEAKEMSAEVPRLAMLFRMDREGKLAKVHKQCSHADPKPVPENHLTCCLGVKCRECPELNGLERMENVTPEDIDEAKAWTCATHIAFKGGDWSREGYVMTVDDRMFWDRIYSNLASSQDPDDGEDG